MDPSNRSSLKLCYFNTLQEYSQSNDNDKYPNLFNINNEMIAHIQERCLMYDTSILADIVGDKLDEISLSTDMTYQTSKLFYSKSGKELDDAELEYYNFFADQISWLKQAFNIDVKIPSYVDFLSHRDMRIFSVKTGLLDEGNTSEFTAAFSETMPKLEKLSDSDLGIILTNLLSKLYNDRSCKQDCANYFRLIQNLLQTRPDLKNKILERFQSVSYITTNLQSSTYIDDSTLHPLTDNPFTDDTVSESNKIQIISENQCHTIMALQNMISKIKDGSMYILIERDDCKQQLWLSTKKENKIYSITIRITDNNNSKTQNYQISGKNPNIVIKQIKSNLKYMISRQPN